MFGSSGSGSGSIFATIVPLVLLLAVMYFLLIRPQKKKEKTVNEMRNNVGVGDEIITIGGICGKVVKTKDDSLVIQVGADKLKFEIMRWAISKVVEKGNIKKTSSQDSKSESEAEAEEAPKKEKRALPKRMKRVSDEPLPEKPADETDAAADTEKADDIEEKAE